MYIIKGELTWVHLLLGVRGTVLPRIWPRILICTLVATGVTVLHEAWFKFPHLLTSTPFVLIGLPLGIFLGFRNTASYDRFWEGRKLWGGLVNTSRSLTRQIAVMVGPLKDGRPIDLDEKAEDEREVVQKELVYRVIGFVHALRMHLRNEPMLERLPAFLPEEEVHELRREKNIPIAVVHRLGERLGELWKREWIHPMHLTVLESSLTAMTDIQGACERIKSTPVPFSYLVLIHRIVAGYCLLLPLGLVDTLSIYTPFAVAGVSYSLFSLDAIGDEIENPFGTDINDLPLLAISRNIEINLRQRVGETDLPAPVEPKQNVLLLLMPVAEASMTASNRIG